MLFPTTFILSLFLFVQVQASDPHIRSPRRHNQVVRNQNTTTTSDLAKRQGPFSNSRFSYFVDGQGACGTVNQPSDFIVALNIEQFGSGEHCYDMITITYNGKSHSAQITDECLGCPYGGLDLSYATFMEFDSGLGIIYGDWEFGSGVTTTTSTTTSTTSTHAKTTSTSKTTSTTKTSTWSAPTSTYSSSSSSSSVAPSSSAPTSAPAPTPTGYLEISEQILLQLGDLIAAAQEV